jgi:hypothetical protein
MIAMIVTMTMHVCIFEDDLRARALTPTIKNKNSKAATTETLARTPAIGGLLVAAKEKPCHKKMGAGRAKCCVRARGTRNFPLAFRNQTVGA